MSSPEPTAPHGRVSEPGVQQEDKESSLQEATRQMPPVEENLEGGLGESLATTDSLPHGSTDVLDHAAETEEVYVILPEGEMNSIPVVETEAVDEAPHVQPSQTEVVETSAVETSPEEVRETDEIGAPGESENLDQLAQGLEDELLSGQDGEAGEVFEPDFSAEQSEEVLQDQPPQEAVTAEALEDEGPEEGLAPGRARWKTLLPLAALALLAVGGYFYYPQIQGYLADQGYPVLATSAGQAGTGPAGGVVTPPKLPVVGGPAAGPGSPVDSGGGTAVAPVDVAGPAKQAKDAFREKFLLAMELGFVGEVPNE